MKKKFFILLPVLLFLVIAVRIYVVFLQQQKEFSFHKNLPKTIKLWSDDFEQNGFIPTECTGEGNSNSPALHWSDLPQGTRSLVILVSDYDAPAPFFKLNTIDHWVVYNISPNSSVLGKGTISSQFSKDSVQFGETITGGVEYVGPNPPMGIHSYYFRIYALSIPLLNLIKPQKQKVMDAMKGHVLSYGELIGRYKKMK